VFHCLNIYSVITVYVTKFCVYCQIGQLSTLPPKERTLEAAGEYARTKQDLPREAFQGGFKLEKIDGPLSKGHLTLVDADVNTTPNVTFNYFKHPYDLERCVYGIRTVERIVRTKHIADLTDDCNYSTDMLLNMSVCEPDTQAH